jgi:D-3-phosphoglycerate dehydrogenase / 2-oxoglutarate reductase
MRVLIADRLPDGHVRALAGRYDVTYRPELTGPELPEVVGGSEVLVVRSTRVTSDTLQAADRLRWVLRAGAGTDTIAVEAAGERGVAVCNLPGRNAAAVAELAMGLLLSLDRRIPEQVADLRAGRWRKGHYATQARGIAGRSVGVAGLGRIGLAFAARVAAFGATVHSVGSPRRDAERQRRATELGIRFVDDLEALAEACDVLSFHLPSVGSTRGVIGQPLLSHVQPGTIILNTSRGDLIDAPALLAELEPRDLWVGLDVYPDEPATPEASFDAELVRHPRVHGTHHVGASTAQAQRAVADGVLEVLEAFARGERPHCVNEHLLTGARA